MSRVNYQIFVNRLTRDRLASYLNAAEGNLGSAIDLYDWNTLAAGALHEDLAVSRSSFAMRLTMRWSGTAGSKIGKRPGIGGQNYSPVS